MNSTPRINLKMNATKFYRSMQAYGLRYSDPSLYAIVDAHLLNDSNPQRHNVVKEVAILTVERNRDDGTDRDCCIYDEMFNTRTAALYDSNNVYAIREVIKTEWFNERWREYRDSYLIKNLAQILDRPYIVLTKGINKLLVLKQIFAECNRAKVISLTTDEFVVVFPDTDYPVLFSNIDAKSSIVFGLFNVKPNNSLLALYNKYIAKFENPPHNKELAKKRFRDARTQKIQLNCSNPHKGMCAARTCWLIYDKWFKTINVPVLIESVYKYKYNRRRE